MKRKWIVWGLAGICAVVLSAWTMINDQTAKGFSDEEAGIRIRKIGHELMLLSGDSLSKVLPVKKIGEGIYRLRFASRFQLVPESLVEITKQSLGPEWQSYSVTVHDCDADATVYGFQQSLHNELNVVPCLGRTYPEGCYTIQVALRAETDETFGAGLFTWTALALGGICFIAFIMFKRKDETKMDGLPLGRYRFVPERRLIVSAQGDIDLSDKETHILDILLKNRNELVKRDLLMKEVWNDPGVLQSRSLDVFISRLRKKLSGDESIEIVNTHGVGYTLTIPQA